MAVPAYAWIPLKIGVLAGLQNIVIGSGVDSREVEILTYKTTHAIKFDNGKPRLVPTVAPPPLSHRPI